MRIGAPPPAPKRKPRLLLVAVLAVGVGILITAAGTLLPRALELAAGRDTATPPSPARSQSVETQIECADIKHAYAGWYTEGGRLASVINQSRIGAGLDLMQLMKGGEEFLNAAKDRPDKPAKQLALDIAAYNVEVSLVNLRLAQTGKIDEEQHQNALKAWRKVDSSYSAFLVLTCA
jgi:hypothetical protein